MEIIKKHWYIGTILSVPPYGIIHPLLIGLQLIGIIWLLLALYYLIKDKE